MVRASRILLIGCIASIVGIVALALLSLNEASDTITVGSVGKTSDTALLYCYGTEKGIFRKHGLNVTYVPFMDAYSQTLAFLAGQVDAASSSPGQAAKAYSEGARFRIGIANGKASHNMLLVRPEIEKVSDLVGKRIGVMGRTSDSYYLISLYLKSRGLDIEKDCEVLDIKNPASMVASFGAGQLDGLVIWTTYAKQVMDLGGKVFIHCSGAAEGAIGHPAYLGIMLLSEEFVANESANNYLRALRETAREIVKDKDGAAQIWAEFCGEPVETMRRVLDMLTLVGDLDEAIQNDMLAFFDRGVHEGYFEDAPGRDVFYDDWR